MTAKRVTSGQAALALLFLPALVMLAGMSGVSRAGDQTWTGIPPSVVDGYSCTQGKKLSDDLAAEGHPCHRRLSAPTRPGPVVGALNEPWPFPHALP